MKRAKMLERIEEEVREIIERYNQAQGAPKRQEHRIKSGARAIFDMLIGFGPQHGALCECRGCESVYK